MATFLDANVLIYYLAEDEQRAARCSGLLSRLEAGEEIAVTSDMVFAEVVWVLSSRRPRPSRESIRDALASIISFRGLNVPHKRLMLDALDLYAHTPIDFIDAYNATLMQKRGLDRVYSYDTDFDRVPGITRVEP